MEGKSSPSSRIHDGDGDEDEEIVVAEDLKGEPIIGDVIWAKLAGGSWWPALIVDRLKENVRVRLYGSYRYMHVDPVKWRSEFQIVLEQNNGSYREIFRKTLKQDPLSSKSGQVNGKMCKSKGKSDDRVSQERTSRNHVRGSSRKKLKEVAPQTKITNSNLPKKHKLQTSSTDEELSGRSPELSARRIRVMQSLGLAAPSGSPFRKIGTVI